MEVQELQNKLRSINRDRFIIPSLFVVTLLRFRNLGHRLITYWDELFHAIAARNLTKREFDIRKPVIPANGAK